MADVEEDIKVPMIEKAFAKTLPSLLLFILLIFLSIGIALSPLLIFMLITGWDNPVPEAGWLDIAAMGIGSVLPWLFLKSKSNSDYSEVSQLFHGIILDNYELGKKLFRSQVKNIDATDEKFVVVSGLARAGTTALCVSLAERGPFKSLDYSNMPLLLAPELWGRVYKPKQGQVKERKHGDQVKIGYASVEALEEYFFKVFLDDHYIQDNHLEKHELDEAVYNNYMLYQALISGDKTYLAKNNNFILRLDSMRRYNQQFVAIMLFRDPVTHARSLMKQHQNFNQLQEEDAFILRYMNWLGHHEFGKGQKVFHFGKKLVEGNSDSLDYWLMVWINYYEYLLSIEAGYFLMDYEDFLRQPENFLKAIARLTDLNIDTTDLVDFDKTLNKDCDNCNAELLQEAQGIYQQLLSRKVQIS